KTQIDALKARGIAGKAGSLDGSFRPLQRYRGLLGKGLDQEDATRRDPCQESVGRGDLLVRASSIVDDEVVHTHVVQATSRWPAAVGTHRIDQALLAHPLPPSSQQPSADR